MQEIDIDISLEDYYTINEKARKEKMLLDDYVNKILKEYITFHSIDKEYSTKPIPSGSHIFTIESFIQECKDGSLIDDDGDGYYSVDNMETNIQAYPSEVSNNPDSRFTHVIWYNK